MATINRTVLRRIPVVEKQTSDSGHVVSGHDMIRMKRSIRSKVQQNEVRRAAGLEAAGRYMAR